MSSSLVLASGNKGKLDEFHQLLAPLGVRVHAQSEFDIGSVEETGLTFVENALLKARHASRLSGLPALADDSGLAVDALNGAPGIFSARFSGVNATDAQNNDALLNALKGTDPDKRRAHYWCVLVYLAHADDPVPSIVQTSWTGRILTVPQGNNGFGYDPLFYLPEQGQTVAELEAVEKNRLSHRGRAMQELLKILSTR
ncbi:RdgB/HAM1 family non-canonical purine NTP pyrophosphatase [Larsenimonas suaedae]|uniref:dITP/XTP pyrophosphatase n=1 Tax=Larsenimonas suaedae TaxID=1851019 RepID=A0ABU1GR49_9GAMM|nr:RdgB/HAM1 family non-canonical purine NTP pyrophosphatase [Larsenimonas suaedae]MCM2972707.1 RdgB/HAM1 family non-canonical purine NTP pyrophosphatase [Larsenimonas suaedae]MDR5894496.1 RdgB/HAM1 family non-canonical purine NTP pyrophosphatase [Larsenimonas suaedae]